MGKKTFTMGLLHNVGWLLLMQTLSELELKKRFRNAMTEEARIAMLEVYHGDFGARIFEKWGFDETYRQISRFHHHPDKTEAPTRELWVVYLANTVAIAAGFDLKENSDAVSMEDADTARRLNLSQETLEKIEAEIAERMAALDGLLV
jgi:HD-like signal output (HDOD) protein